MAPVNGHIEPRLTAKGRKHHRSLRTVTVCGPQQGFSQASAVAPSAFSFLSPA